jgi:subtilisin family serine protease
VDLEVDVYFKSRWLNAVLVQMNPEVLSSVEALPRVERVELVAPGERLTREESLLSDSISSGEPVRKNQLANALQNNMIGVDRMHQDGYTGNNILIGIFDAGFTGVNRSIYFNHLFENDRILASRDFIRNSGNVFQYDDHGTGVLSTIAGYEAFEYEGIAYNAEIILCVTEDVPSEYIIEEYNWLFAAEFADSLGVDIINTSLGYNTFDDISMNYEYDDLDGNTAVITRATDIAASKGILCVVSVGNEGNNSWKKLVAPADADSALAVGAVNSNLTYIPFSSTGPTVDDRIKPDVVALGMGTQIVRFDGEISFGSGTSFASPLIAGLAAGLWEAFPELNNIELIDLIRRGSSQYHSPDTLLGYGIPDYGRIVSFITALDEESLTSEFKVYPNPVDNNKLFVEGIGEAPVDNLKIHIHDLNGKRVFELVVPFLDPTYKLELDLTGIGKGVYILNISHANYAGKTKIIIP